MDDIGCNLIQECSVVRHDQNGGRVGLQVLGKVSDGRNVQHVGRLIKKQKIRFTEQRTGQGQTHAPTSRERLGSELLPLWRESQTGKNSGSPRFGFVGFHLGQLGMHIREQGVQFVALTCLGGHVAGNRDWIQLAQEGVQLLIDPRLFVQQVLPPDIGVQDCLYS